MKKLSEVQKNEPVQVCEEQEKLIPSVSAFILRLLAWGLIIFGAVRCLPLMFFFIVPYALADQEEEKARREREKALRNGNSSGLNTTNESK